MNDTEKRLQQQDFGKSPDMRNTVNQFSESPSEDFKKELEKDTVSSLLDLDLYKLTMGQFAWKFHPDVPVTYEFKNRTTKVKLAEVIDKDILEFHFKKIQQKEISEEEIDYLRSVKAGKDEVRVFEEEYLQSLKNMELPDVKVAEEDGQYKIETTGPWSTAIYWETLILSTVNELYYRNIRHNPDELMEITNKNMWEVGKEKLSEKIAVLKDFIHEKQQEGYDGPKFMDFGTRRRYEEEWHRYTVEEMKKAFYPKNFIGTSNVALAKDLDIPAIGTFAHEMDMVYSGIHHELDDNEGKFESHNRMLKEWYEYYGEPLSIALTDTYGSDFFFENFTKEQAKEWNGLRQDSGDPIEFGEKAIKFYEDNDIDPNDKMLVFSDGLDVNTIKEIYDHFKGRVNMIFGWGTTLTNDVGFDTLSLVMKATQANDFETAKISDNLAKATGDTDRAKILAGYTGNSYVETVV